MGKALMQAFDQRLPPWLVAKLNPPATGHSVVMRNAVRDLINSAQAARVILLRAPAGFGKTTTMAQIRARMMEQGVVTSWLTLDRADNDTSRFIESITAAVARIMAGQGPRTTGGLRRASVSHDFAVDRLSACPFPFALFFDDVHTLDEPTVVRLLRQVVEQLPPFGRMVLGSRTLPPLGLDCLGERAQVLELDSHILRFSMAETMEFFAQCRGQALRPQDLYSVQKKTEGWVAALGLASAALTVREERSEFIARFSGSDQAVADYLANEVFACQPADVQTFLLGTCIARQLTAPLCNALTGRRDSDEVLKSLEAANLFLVSIESEEEPTYRYHSLFSGFLRGFLARTQPEEGRRLHSVAASWYEAEDRPVPAIDHALAGGDHEHALRLLAEHAEDLLGQGRMRLLQRWFPSVPAKQLAHNPLLQVIYVWSVCLTQGAVAAATLLEQLGCQDSEDAAVHSHLVALRQLILSSTDRYEEAVTYGRDTLCLQAGGKSFADSINTNMLGYCHFVVGQSMVARKLWDAARRSHHEGASAFNTMLSESMEGIADLLGGQLRQATARFSVAIGATRTLRPTYTSGNSWAGVLYASVLYEADDWEQAERLLQVYLPRAEEAGLTDPVIIGYIMLARIVFDHGDVDRAHQYMDALEELGRRRALPRLVATARLERARLLLFGVGLEEAREELARADDRETWQGASGLHLLGNDLVYPELCRLRWEIWAGNAAAALSDLERETRHAVADSRHRRALALRLLHSVALYRAGDRASAVTLLGNVLRSACAEGYRRLILDEGEVVWPLLRHFESAYQKQSFERPDPIFTEYLQRLMRGFEAGSGAADGGLAAGAGKPAPLTSKETRILRLVAEGCSNNTMAEKLYVSESTVRTHLRNIYAKLGARSRTQAVAIARRCHLLQA